MLLRIACIASLGLAAWPACSATLGGGDEPASDSPGSGEPDIEPGDDLEPVGLSYTPSNIPADRFLAAADLALTGLDAVYIDTDELTIESDGGSDLRPDGIAYVHVSQGQDLPDLAVFSVGELYIGPGVRVEVTGSAALVFAVGGSATVEGTVVATGGRDGEGDLEIDAPGPGGYAGGNGDQKVGLGPGGGRYGGDDLDVGGGGGGHFAAGGAGGDLAGTPGGAGGPESGAADLVPLVGGSGGARGGGEGGPGGGGGGAIQISAAQSIEFIQGGINAGGAGGATSEDDDGGGGGGAGGAILLEAESIVLIESILAVNGGGGGSGGELEVPGNDGLPGELDESPAAGGAAVPGGAAGGGGGASGDPAGQVGQGFAEVTVSENSGGGGGGGGRIMVRAASQSSVNATLSPEEAVDTRGL